MQIKNVPIKEIIPYERNNRVHSDQQIDRIANSLHDFGFNQPIVVDEANVILVGHGRLFASLKLGLKDVPVYKLGGLTPAQKKAYRILDNKLQNDSTWNVENLPLELQELRELGFNFEKFGLEELEFPVDDDTSAVEDPIRQYMILIECVDELSQTHIYDKLQAEGITCKIIT